MEVRRLKLIDFLYISCGTVIPDKCVCGKPSEVTLYPTPKYYAEFPDEAKEREDGVPACSPCAGDNIDGKEETTIVPGYWSLEK